MEIKRITLHPELSDGTVDLNVNLYPKSLLDGIVDREGNEVEIATKEELSSKQDSLVSGENIKTVNGSSILGPGDLEIKDLIEIAWADLKSLRDNSQLRPGKFYRITDYQCTTTQENTSSAGHQFDIIVLALSENTLSEEAFATLHEGDTYFANYKLGAWKLWYCLDNDTNRFAWADNYGIVIDNIIYVRNSSSDDITKTYGYVWSNGTTNRYTDTASPTTETKAHKFQTGTGGTEYIISSIHQEAGKGVIYRMIDEFSNDIPYDFKNILFTKSGKYTAAYTFTYVDSGVNKDGSLARAAQECYNNIIKGYYGNSEILKLNWTIFYCSEVDTVKNLSVYGNLIGENNHDNDFIGYFFHDNTIGNIFNNNSIGSLFHGNRIGVAFHDNTIDSSFQNNIIGNSFSNNTIGIGFEVNTIGYYFAYNTTCKSFQNNTIGHHFHHNTISGELFAANTIGNNFYYNTIDSWFQANSVGNKVSYNVFGYYITLSEIGDGCSYVQLDAPTGSYPYTKPLRYIHLSRSLSGASTQNMLVITPVRKATYEQEFVDSKKMIISVEV